MKSFSFEARPRRAPIQAFAAADADLVLGGTFLDLPFTQRVKLPRNSLQFDPASGLFDLSPHGPTARLTMQKRAPCCPRQSTAML